MVLEFRQIDDSPLLHFLASISVEVGLLSTCLAQSRHWSTCVGPLGSSHFLAQCDSLLRWPCGSMSSSSCPCLWSHVCGHLVSCTRVGVHSLRLRSLCHVFVLIVVLPVFVLCSCCWCSRCCCSLLTNRLGTTGAAEGSPSCGRRLGQDGGRGRTIVHRTPL